MNTFRIALVGAALFWGVAAISAATAAEPVPASPVFSDTAVEAAVQLEERQGYNSDYIFGMSRGLANSTMTPALKPLFFVFTIPLDIAFLPFAAIGGFF